MPASAIVCQHIALKDITHPFPHLRSTLFQGWSAFCLLPFMVTQMTALRLSPWLAGPGQECACLAFVPEHPDSEDPGDQPSKGLMPELHCGALHLSLQAFVSTRLQGGGGHGNYAKAMHYSDKVIHQIISHNFNSSLEFSLLPEPAGYYITEAVEKVEH